MTSPDFTLDVLSDACMDAWLEGNLARRGERHLRRLLDFWRDVQEEKRVIWAAWDGDAYLGQITVQNHSEYPPFRKAGVFEIVDLWVDEDVRGRGIGRALLHLAIAHAHANRCAAIGLGVGVTSDFGAAQRLYAQEGFVPDGSGLWVQGRQARPEDQIALEDGVIMMWVKTL